MSGAERVENLMRLRLTPGVGSLSMARLLRHFGNSTAILGASAAQLAAVEGLRQTQVTAILQAEKIDPRPEIEAALAANISLLTYDAPDYPAALANIADPPFLLYVKGKLLPVDEQALGIVGTRRASHYGREMAGRFAADLARIGFTVVSGLARGIDTCAHRGALAVGGRTIAFVGCGFNHYYPPENRDLLAEITQNGAVISEFTLNTPPARENFPSRNRLIAGIALGVLVVESGERGGSLITARQALEMNREVFAVPGRIDHEESCGCHTLIREGAILVRRVDDILDELPATTAAKNEKHLPALTPTTPPPTPAPDAAPESSPNFAAEMALWDAAVPASGAAVATPAPTAELGLAPEFEPTTTADSSPAQQVLAALRDADSLHVDELAERLTLNTGEMLSLLLNLEMRHLVAKEPGNFYRLSHR